MLPPCSLFLYLNDSIQLNNLELLLFIPQVLDFWRLFWDLLSLAFVRIGLKAWNDKLGFWNLALLREYNFFSLTELFLILFFLLKSLKNFPYILLELLF